MGVPFDITIMTVSSAFGTSSTIPLGTAATVNGVTYLSFANAGATGGTVVDYSILDTNASEIGTATYTSSNATLTSRTPTKSTNGNTAINASSASLVLATIRAESLTPYITTGQLIGTATNDAANAGNVGEVFNVGPTSASFTSTIPANINSVTLSPGDWELSGIAVYGGAGATTTTDVVTAISTTSASVIAGLLGIAAHNRQTATADFSCTHTLLPQQVSLASSTQYFLNGQATFTVSTYGVTGIIHARRAR